MIPLPRKDTRLLGVVLALWKNKSQDGQCSLRGCFQPVSCPVSRLLSASVFLLLPWHHLPRYVQDFYFILFLHDPRQSELHQRRGSVSQGPHTECRSHLEAQHWGGDLTPSVQAVSSVQMPSSEQTQKEREISEVCFSLRQAAVEPSWVGRAEDDSDPVQSCLACRSKGRRGLVLSQCFPERELAVNEQIQTGN